MTYSDEFREFIEEFKESTQEMLTVYKLGRFVNQDDVIDYLKIVQLFIRMVDRLEKE